MSGPELFQNFINSNEDSLCRSTWVDLHLLVRMESQRLISTEERQNIVTHPAQLAKAKALYRILSLKFNVLPRIVEVLKSCGNSAAAGVFEDFARQNPELYLQLSTEELRLRSDPSRLKSFTDFIVTHKHTLGCMIQVDYTLIIGLLASGVISSPQRESIQAKSDNYTRAILLLDVLSLKEESLSEIIALLKRSLNVEAAALLQKFIKS